MSTILLISLPYGLLVSAILLRAVVSVQRDSVAAEKRRILLLRASVVLMALALVGMSILAVNGYAVGVIGLILGLSVCVSIIYAEIRFAGVQNRAREAELLWVLATAVKLGRPLAAEVDAYARGTTGRRHRLLTAMADRLHDGQSLTELAVPQGLLPDSATMQIHSGVLANSLQESLSTTAARATRELAEDQKSNLGGSSLAYPLMLISVAFLVIGFIMYYIIPKYLRIFEDFNTELPDVTESLVHASNIVARHWAIMGLPLFVYIPASLLILVGFAEYYSWPILLQSILGRWFIRWHTPDVLRSLAQGIAQRIPLDQALDPIVRFAGPLKLRRQLGLALDDIRDGDPCWQTLQSRGILSSAETYVLESAERAGNLPWVLQTLADNLDRRRLFRIRTWLEFLQPIALVIVGLAIGCLIVALFLPVLKLLNDCA
ncbi:type II secretion system F family protein [Schlesneria paludicola]|uniref:type II secretion system F family protein n=1 Tax=Schlesneria paludicola TaxID=360056 RepID=UPI000299E90A|nr:type II secretion system F family protein [Schlesneria paludicola]